MDSLERECGFVRERERESCVLLKSNSIEPNVKNLEIFLKYFDREREWVCVSNF